MRWRATLVLVLVLGQARAFAAPQKILPREAAEAVLKAFEAKDAAALAEWGAREHPQPWIVADELLSMGQPDAAEALAAARTSKDRGTLIDYLASERTKPYDQATHRVIDALIEHLGKGEFEQALAAIKTARPLRANATEARLYAAYGDVYDALKRPEEAMEARAVNGERARILGWLWLARGHFDDAGLAAFQRKDYLRCIEWERKALAAAEAYDSPKTTRIRHALGNSLGNLGAFREAIQHLEVVRAAYQARKDESGLASVTQAIGALHLQLGDLETGLAMTEAALRKFEALGDARSSAFALANVGLIHKLRGDLAKALEYETRVLAIYEAAGDARMVTTVRTMIGRLHAERGENARALTELERALEDAEKAGSVSEAADALDALAVLHSKLGDTPRALEEVKKAIAMFERTGEKSMLATTTQRLAEILMNGDGDWTEALAPLERARALFDETGSAHGVAWALGSLAEVQMKLGRTDDALVTVARSLDGARKAKDVASITAALRVEARIRHRRKEGALAVAGFAKALESARAGNQPAVVAMLLDDLARAELAIGKNADALRHAREAAQTSEGLSQGLGDELGASSRSRWSGSAGTGLEAARRLNDLDAAFYLLERGRAGALLEALGNAKAIRDAVLPEDLRRAEADASASEKAAAKRLAAARGGDLHAGPSEVAKTDWDAARNRLREVIERIQRTAKAGADLVHPTPVGRTAAQKDLAAGDVLVMYDVTEDGSLALVLTPTSARLVSLGEPAAIREAAEKAVRAVEGGGDDAPVAALRTLVVNPLRLDATARRVLVSPSGPLSYVPFALLVGDRDLAHVPSATTLSLLRSTPARGEGVLALGDPDYLTGWDGQALALLRRGATLTALPATRDEANAVGTVVLLGKDATESGLRLALSKRPRWRAVHLACHGLVDPERPMLSSLALTPDAEDDGFLSAIEVFRTKIPADLAVLSACETGQGKVYEGEGIVGWTRAFMFAGAPRVLVSLWNVDDRATRMLMEKFYALWGDQGLGAAAALRKAQHFVRDHEEEVVDPAASRAAGRDVTTKKTPYAAPRYWAGWALWGLPD
jgi:tetratricopeptide (TPR) repeat protein